jgi:glutamyl-tRNA synthetase
MAQLIDLSDRVRTRFAPSPTGYLHIGGVRTALFCWLFARKHKGQFILRIDDTDIKRNVDEALQPILDGLRWLGIDWDEGPGVDGPFAPYFQSKRLQTYQQAVEQLLANGNAYYDYATTEELQAEREAALAEKRSFRYSRRWMAETLDQRERFQSEGRQAVVRLKIPHEGKLVLNDLVRGRVEFDWAQEQDHVIQRADGTCLYHLANVVDDQAFQITHVIRAEEHLSNTPRQVFMIHALGYSLPKYAHLPFVAEPGSKTKLSKRKLDKYLKNREFAERVEHGRRIAERLGLKTDLDTFNPVIVDFYRQVGYLPEAIINYLALLGWSAGDDREQYTRPELIQAFSLEGVNKAPASFDPQKLWAFQDRHMREVPADDKVAMVLPYLERAGLVTSPAPTDARNRVAAILQSAGDRVKVAGDILDYDDFFTPDDRLVFDEKDFEKRIRKPPEAVELLVNFRQELASVEPFDAPALERLLHEFVERQGIKIGQVIHALRVAVTGKSIGFGLFDTLAILGRESVLRRIERAVEQV